ncbi:MAG: hypothetical protein AAGA56_25005 [Myxococcota bacterium]
MSRAERRRHPNRTGAPPTSRPTPIFAALASYALAPSAWGQEAPPLPPPGQPPAVAPAPAPVAAVPPPPQPAPAPVPVPSPEGEEPDDHDVVVGEVGVSWLGVSNVPIATGAPTGTGTDPSIDLGEPATVSAPAIGIRYCFNKTFAIEAGVGFFVSTGQIDTTTSATDKQTVFAFLLHAGAPISLYSRRHISLQITPELSFGHARSESNPPCNSTRRRPMRF